MSWILLASPNELPCSPKCTAPTLGDCIRDGRQCLNESVGPFKTPQQMFEDDMRSIANGEPDAE